jgi:hypothetical protein
VLHHYRLQNLVLMFLRRLRLNLQYQPHHRLRLNPLQSLQRQKNNLLYRRLWRLW